MMAYEELVDALWPPGSEARRRLEDSFSLFAAQASFDRWMTRCENGLAMRAEMLGAFMGIDRKVDVTKLKGLCAAGREMEEAQKRWVARWRAYVWGPR